MLVCTVTKLVVVWLRRREGRREEHEEADPERVYLDYGTMEYFGNQIEEGDKLRVTYPSEYGNYYEEDTVRLWDGAMCQRALNKLMEMCGDDSPDLSPMNLAMYTHTLFWNLARLSSGDVAESLRALLPGVKLNKRRKKRKEGEKTESEQNKASDKRRQQMEQQRAEYKKVVDAKFKRLSESCNEHASKVRRRREELEREKEASNRYGDSWKSNRLKADVKDTNAFLEKIVDKKANVFKVPLADMSTCDRTKVYSYCLEHNFKSPVLLTRFEKKGRGVAAAGVIMKDDFVIEYKGKLLNDAEAKIQDMRYNRANIHKKGSFMFYFKHMQKNYCIDSTEELADYGVARLINHSRRRNNLIAKTLVIDEVPRLCFIAKRNMEEGEELLVDYGERDPEVIRKNPWLNA
eukprot:GHVQ01034815.1.p1 GENE.GHVQ01034815.1~~GHVQ01034815.1.p1  ORF type:complete len:405 (+),score=65.60 GHVQ01034815.1:647-1861(+)